MRKSIFILYGTGALIFVVAAGWYAVSLQGPGTGSATRAVVSMTDEEFSPAALTIKAGARVDFINTSTSSYYWPASDPHPTHDLYSEFDPGRPLSPGETWSFVFTEVGSWRMHDHLHPNELGVITVTP